MQRDDSLGLRSDDEEVASQKKGSRCDPRIWVFATICCFFLVLHEQLKLMTQSPSKKKAGDG